MSGAARAGGRLGKTTQSTGPRGPCGSECLGGLCPCPLALGAGFPWVGARAPQAGDLLFLTSHFNPVASEVQIYILLFSFPGFWLN